MLQKSFLILHSCFVLSSVRESQLDVSWNFLCILEMLSAERYGNLYWKVCLCASSLSLAHFISFIKLVLKLKEHVQLKLTVWVLSKYFPNMKTFAMLILRTYVNHVRNICHLELANLMKKHTLLIIR